MGLLTIPPLLLLVSAIPSLARAHDGSNALPKNVPGTCLLQSVTLKQRPLLIEEDTVVLASPAAPTPRTLLWNGSALAALRKKALSGKPPAWAAQPLAALKARADERLGLNESLLDGVHAGPWSPTDKTSIQSPDGDQRSFAAYGTYAWPCNYTCNMALEANPSTNTSCSKWERSSGPCNRTSGLPYVIHDGFPNSDVGLDSKSIVVMADTLELLTLAWWFTDETKYASAAMKVFRAWFVDTATRMNPNMEYGHLMPGQDGGVPSVIPASLHFNARLDDCVAILETQSAKVWTPAIAAAWTKWSGDWLAWWSTSQTGIANSEVSGSQGTYYHVHKLAMAYSLNQADVCVDLVAKLQEKLPCSLNHQIAADGEMPEESRRVAGVSYSLRNLEGLISLAIMAQRVCATYRCTGSVMAFDKETAVPERGGTWSETVGVYTKCGKRLGHSLHSRLDSCKEECLGPTRPDCDTVLVRRGSRWYACVFKDCRGESARTFPDQKWTAYTYTGSRAPGRGSIRKAFEYLEQFADGADNKWLRIHRTTDTLDAEPAQFERLGKLSRMISSSLLGSASRFEAKVGMYDSQFSTSWESLVFPPPEFVASGK